MNLLRACAILCLLVVTNGCSKTAHDGRGIVRFVEGPPVQAGSVEFRALKSGTRYASKISEQGEFQLADEQGEPGIAAGEYEVVVVQMVITEDLAATQHSHGGTVPRRYADYYTSGLRTEVKPEQQEVIMIVVESK